MSGLAVVTPSYRVDRDLCADLHASVLRHTPDDVVHHVIVPKRDLALFRALEGPRLRLRTQESCLPRHFVAVPGTASTLNLRRPVPPVRGWVRQQLVKLAAVLQAPARTVLVVDSDSLLVRDVDEETFLDGGQPRLFRRTGAVHAGMARHVAWHRGARALFGVPAGNPPYDDFVTSTCVWDRQVLSTMLSSVEERCGKPWPTVLGGQLHLSEMVLYGVYACEVLGLQSRTTELDLCHSYWPDVPLDDDGADAFLAGLPPEAVAVSLSSKSRTPLDVRRRAFARLGEA